MISVLSCGLINSFIGPFIENFHSQRPSPRLAADVLQLLLWAPAGWLLPSNRLSRSQVTWWLITMATDARLSNQTTGSDLKRCFMEDISSRRLMNAFGFMGVTVLDC